MPQMFPLNWVILPSFFILVLLSSFTLLYYIFLQPTEEKIFLKKNNIFTWLW